MAKKSRKPLAKEPQNGKEACELVFNTIERNLARDRTLAAKCKQHFFKSDDPNHPETGNLYAFESKFSEQAWKDAKSTLLNAARLHADLINVAADFLDPFGVQKVVSPAVFRVAGVLVRKLCPGSRAKMELRAPHAGVWCTWP
jgi:hypothetical protein